MCKCSGIRYVALDSGLNVSNFPCSYSYPTHVGLERAIYSSAKGFLGGAAWSVLVARVCQLYPNAAVGTIICRFFIIMHQWYGGGIIFTIYVEGLNCC